MSTYNTASLAFYDDKIVVEDSGSEYNNIEVMMSWEHPMMSASAAYVTQNRGDILEIGFGMGMSAGYIQSHSISSHTIVENHPQIIEKAEKWASGKANVTIVSQSIEDCVDSLGTYDGIFWDAFGDVHFYDVMSGSLDNLKKNTGTKLTFFHGALNDDYLYHWTDVEYEAISISPDDNNYYPHEIYYMPKLEI